MNTAPQIKMSRRKDVAPKAGAPLLKRILRLEDVAAQLSCSAEHVRNLIVCGKLAASDVRTGKAISGAEAKRIARSRLRVSADALQAFMHPTTRNEATQNRPTK